MQELTKFKELISTLEKAKQDYELGKQQIIDDLVNKGWQYFNNVGEVDFEFTGFSILLAPHVKIPFDFCYVSELTDEGQILVEGVDFIMYEEANSCLCLTYTNEYLTAKFEE